MLECSDGAVLRKTAFLRHLYIKMIILPRQAQDKHRENSKKDAVFRTCTAQNSLSLLLVPAEHTAVQQSLMFVPSLSWQPIPLLYSTYENDANNGVFSAPPHG